MIPVKDSLALKLWESPH